MESEDKIKDAQVVQRGVAMPTDVVLLTEEDVAELLGCSQVMVRKLRREGQLGYVKVGALVRVSLSELQRFVSKNRVDAGVPNG